MRYEKDKLYNIVYITKKGEEKEIEYVPNETLSIAQLITNLKNEYEDFFKLKTVTDNSYKDEEFEEIESDEELNESVQNNTITTLYEFLEATNFEDIDITDTQNDMLVAFCLDPEQGDSDNYNQFLTKLAKELEISPLTLDEIHSKNISILPVNMTKWVEDNFDKLDSIFDVGGQDKEDEISDLVLNMESVIAGATSEPVYKALNENKLIKEAVEENNEDDFEEIESDDSLKGSGEDQTETAETVKEAIDDIEDNVTAPEAFAIESSNSSIDVLVADEQTAIDGYNSFLNQCQDTLIPSLYEVLKKEIDEIIADEEDHINKLNTIKDTFKIQNLPPINEEKTINYKEKIVNYFRQKGLSDNEIAFKILDDILNVSILEFALKQLNDSKAKEYYSELAEMYESKNIDKDSSLDDIAQYIINNFEEITGIKIDNVFNDSTEENAQIFNQDIIDATYPSIEKYLKEKGITCDEDLLDKIDDKLMNSKNKSLEESIKHFEDLEVGDVVTIPYARGPKYTQDKSQWVKAKIININPDYVDLEVPTTLTVTARQLSSWLTKIESKSITEDHQLYYDDIQNMSTKERHQLWMKEHDKDFEDTEAGNTIFWDWAEEEFPIKELNENKTLKTEDSYDEGIFYEIEEALRDAGLNPVRFIEEGVLTNNIGWTVIGEDGTRQQLTCDGSYLSESKSIKLKTESKFMEFSTESEKDEYIKEHNLEINIDYKDKGPVAIELLKESKDLDKEDEHKYNLVLDIAEIYPDSPQEEEDGDMIMDYIKNHPEKSADEIAQLYLDYLEDGDTTILESKSLKESDTYNDLETKMEKEVYDYILSNNFDPFDIDPDNSDAENQLNEIIEDFQPNTILDYMEKHNIELTWECSLDHFRPYGIKIHVWKV